MTVHICNFNIKMFLKSKFKWYFLEIHSFGILSYLIVLELYLLISYCFFISHLRSCPSLVQSIIKNAHRTPLSCQWALEKTIQLMRMSYFWPTISNLTIILLACWTVKAQELLPFACLLAVWTYRYKSDIRNTAKCNLLHANNKFGRT
jgi:hypothetical protein